MNVTFKEGNICIANLDKDSTEILMDALVDHVNRLHKKSNNPSKTAREIEQIRSDKMKALKMYRDIETRYMAHMMTDVDEMVDTKQYNEELVR